MQEECSNFDSLRPILLVGGEVEDRQKTNLQKKFNLRFISSPSEISLIISRRLLSLFSKCTVVLKRIHAFKEGFLKLFSSSVPTTVENLAV